MDPQEARSDADIEEDERFFLSGRAEIAFALDDLIHRGELVTVSFNRGADLMLTTLLALDRLHDRVIFDWGGSEEADRKLLASERNIFVAKPDGIKVQFVTGPVEETLYGERKAFVTALPERVIRLQRREAYRVLAPLARPLFCHIVDDDGNVLKLAIHDLSVGGVGLTLPRPSEQFEVGKALSRVRIELPGLGEIACSASVRIGCRFEGLTHPMQALIQRYIVALERARRNMTPD